MDERKFRARLGMIGAAALVLRVAAALFVDHRMGVTGDGVWYVGVARLIDRGVGFVEPLSFAVHHVRLESASHPPLYPLFLSAADLLGFHSLLAHRLWSCVPGTITVVVVGLIGREVDGRRAGLYAAGVAAMSFALVLQDVLLWSEGFFGMTIALTVLSAYRYLRSPRRSNALVLAVAVTVAALTRAEAALLFFVLVLPLVLRLERSAVRRIQTLAAASIVVVALLAPWTLYNASRFDHPVVLSTGLGGLLASSNCDVTYHGPLIGGWGGLCAQGLPAHLPRDESQADLLFRRIGWRYVRGHASALTAVVPVRLLRTFGFWQPIATTKGDLQLAAIGLDRVAWVMVAQYWLLLVVGLVGGVRLYRRRVSLLPLVAPIITVVVISVIGYGTMRFRIAFDVVLPVGVGVAVASGWGKRRAADAGPTEPTAPASGILSA